MASSSLDNTWYVHARPFTAHLHVSCYRYVKLFAPLLAPEDSTLKELYSYLGAAPLSHAVRVQHVTHGEPSSSAQLARLVYARVIERGCLLLHDIDLPSCPLRADLKPGAADLLSVDRLYVAEVSVDARRLRE